MSYDFTTRIDRGKTNSLKWMMMRDADPQVPADVVPMTFSDMEFTTQPEVLSLIRQMADGAASLGYSVPDDDYYISVLNWQQRRHHFLANRDWVVVAPGVIPALLCLVRALTELGDGVVIQEPVCSTFRAIVERSGRKVVANPLALDGTRYEIDYADLERVCSQPSTKALLLCNPHNPVGRVWSRVELRRLADICLSNGVFIIADETYNDVVLPPYEHVTIMDVLEGDEREYAVLCTSPSKAFNLMGCQCANVFIPSEGLRAKFADELMWSSSAGLNPFAISLGETAYLECGGWLDELLVYLAQNRETLSSFVAANLPNVGVVPLEGTHLQWLDFRAWGLPDTELRSFMEHDARLFVSPGADFGKQGAGFVRMNIACPSQVLKEALSRLLKAAKARELVLNRHTWL